MKKSPTTGHFIRRVLIALSLFTLFLFFSPVNAYADEYTDENGTVWQYTVMPAGVVYPYPGTALIQRCSNIPESGVLEVPASLGGAAVSGIEGFTFRGNKSIQEVILPQGFKYIGNNAFSYCSNLKKINFPSSLATIETNAFDGSGLETIEFPDSMTCTVRSGAFYSCRLLRSVVINGDVVFDPSAGDVFRYCSSLTGFTVSGSNANYAAQDGVLYSKDMTRLEAYPIGKEGTSFTVPDSVKEICTGAFESSRLEDILLPESLEAIGERAFSNCRSLQSVDVSASVNSLGAYCFNLCDNLTDISLHEGLESVGERAFVSCKALESLELPDGVTSIGDGAFVSMADLKYLYVPDSVSEIGTELFEGTGGVTLYTTNEQLLAYAQDNGIESVSATREEYQAAVAAGQQDPGDDPDPGTNPPGGDPDPGTDPPPVTPVAQKQTITCRAAFTKGFGKTFYLNAKAKTALTYKSSNRKVATVSRAGKVKITGCGTCRITITAAKTDSYYAAKKTVTIKGRLVRPALKGANVRTRKAKLYWNKVNGASGYRLYVRYPGAKKYVPALKLPAKVKGVTHSDLSKGKTYRYKLRAYRKSGKKTYYSSYSKVVRISIKK